MINKDQMIYLVFFILLLVMEIVIAIFVHDDFIRPYVGDILAVGVVYCFVRIFRPTGIVLLPFYVFLFAVVLEILPFIDFIYQIIQKNKIFGIVFGSTFDWKDIICYGIGCIIIVVIDFSKFRKLQSQ